MPGFVGEWHENPIPQWIISLRGHCSFETMDEVIVDTGPGISALVVIKELITEKDFALGQ
jgi:hypothetical protein